MNFLAVESSCDETGVAVVANGRVLANPVASQSQLHEEYGGVVPELAAREHLKNLLPVARLALKQAGMAPEAIEGVAATQGPGLPNALMVGFRAAQAMAFALQRPFYGIHHHEAHLYSPWVAAGSLVAEFERLEPGVSLIVSGGHTLLVHVAGELEHRVVGSTVDDAAGECFDKTAKLLGLPYPGGPHLDELAERGNPEAFAFPRPMLREAGYDFSFSGLKTSVRYFLGKQPELLEDPQSVADLCASVRAAIVEVLTAKTIRAARELRVSGVTASGGVSCNRALRRALQEACEAQGLGLRLADPALCTDNAAMVGLLAERKSLRGVRSTPLNEEVRPYWPLPGTASEGSRPAAPTSPSRQAP